MRDIIKKIQTITWIKAGIYYLVFSTFIAIGLHLVLPNLMVSIPRYILYYISLGIPLIIGLALSIHYFKKEVNNGLYDLTFKERFRLHKMNLKDWIHAIGLVLFWFISFILINSVTSRFLNKPSYVTSSEGQWFSVSLEGQYWILIFLIIFLILNVYGEELFWRGYLQPRLEKRYGKKAWVINGLLWTLFHLPVFYIMPAIAPGAILLCYFVQKQKNTNIGIVGHFALNGFELIGIAAIIFGLKG